MLVGLYDEREVATKSSAAVMAGREGRNSRTLTRVHFSDHLIYYPPQ